MSNCNNKADIIVYMAEAGYLGAVIGIILAIQGVNKMLYRVGYEMRRKNICMIIILKIF